MKLIFLYGPPGVGKLTVAEELSKLTGYKIFHNHLTANIAHLLFELGSEEAFMYSRKLRLNFFEQAALHKVSLIHTFVYYPDAPLNQPYLDQVVHLVEAGGGEVCWVQLLCKVDVLEQRVQSPSRVPHGKLTDPARLKELLQRLELFTPVPLVNSFALDTTHLSAEASAKAIAEHFGLPELSLRADS